MQKITFYLQQFLRYQNLKILQSDWTRAFFHSTREPDFFQTCGFNRIIKVIVVYDLNAKILHISGVFFFFFCKIQKNLFVEEAFWALSQKWNFFPKIRLRQFFIFKAP